MPHIFYRAEEKSDPVGGDVLFIKEKYEKDYRGYYLRTSSSAGLLLTKLEPIQEEEEALMKEVNGYRLYWEEEETADHDDMGRYNVGSDRELIPWDSSLIKGILLKDGHFFGVYVKNTCLVIDGTVYGKDFYSLTPNHEDTSRTSYYRYGEYRLYKSR